jgi:3'-phosphoadenosine 5'-phosphosulfate sulfotransferase (PAPS reductase)/FAD synthetase
MPPPNRPDLASYDVILVNTSAGKDSQAMLDLVVTLATAPGVADGLVAVHADLGRVEWQGTRELAERQAYHYGVRFEVVLRDGRDLLEEVEHRGMWPDSKNRYCTSYYKRDQVATLVTQLVDEVIAANGFNPKARKASRRGPQVRVLNCIGIRAAESDERAAMVAFETDDRLTNGKRHVDTWFPLFTWSVQDVWARITASGVEHHSAYDLGMSRLSCVFCVLAPAHKLELAGRHNPELLGVYAALEVRIGHRFKHDFSIAALHAKLQAEQACAA